jgi:hypothetical protein
MALVHPLKNNDTEEYEEPIDAVVDGIAARGFFPQVDAEHDELVGITRDTNGNLVLKDTHAGTRVLTDLLGGGSGLPPEQILDMALMQLDGTFVFDNNGCVLSVTP